MSKPRTLDQIRAEITRTREQIAELQRADLPVSEVDALARLDGHIKVLVEEGNQHLIDQAKNLSRRTKHPVLLISNYWAGNADQLMRNVEASICAANPALYRDAIAQRIRDFYASSAGAPMAEPERLKRLEKLNGELTELERIEYQTCIEQGLPIRGDTNPALVLGL